MDHGVVEVFAYQETLLIMAVFGVAILTMIWIGFRRWLQHKEKASKLFAEQYGAHLERVDARLKALEQGTSEDAQPAARIEAPATNLRPDPTLMRDEPSPNPR